MFKNFLSFTVGVTIVLMLSGSALAAEGRISNQEQAKATAKELLPQLIGDKQLEADFTEDGYRGLGVWNLYASEERPVRYIPSNQLNIAIDENGSLLSFDYRDTKLKAGDQKVIDRSKAQAIAKDFLAKMKPNILDQIKLEDTTSNPYNYRGNLDLIYSFRWNRVVNGLPVRDNGATINVDAMSGQVTHYDVRWDDQATFPAPSDNLKKPAEISSLVLEKLGVYPTYRTSPTDPTGSKVQLVYQLNAQTYSFDAVTGKPVDYLGNMKEFTEVKRFDQDFSPEIGGQATIPEHNAKEQITPEKAQLIAQEFFKKLGYTGEVTRSGGGTSSGPGFQLEHWDYSVAMDAAGDPYGDRALRVSIDTSTGKIIGFQNWAERYSGKEAKNISYEQARTIAEQFIKQELSLPYPFVLQKESIFIGPGEPYYLNFVSLIHGIPCDLSNINIQVNRNSGKVIGYHSQFLPLRIPKLEKIITPQEATKVLQESQSYELCYIFPYNKEQAKNKQAQLVYIAKDYGLDIDAVTGKVLTKGVVATGARQGMENHWAAGPLRLLAENGLLPEKEINPDGQITRRDALKMMGSLNDHYSPNKLELKFTDIKPDDPDAAALKQAITMGILENQGTLRPNEPLTREQLAVWLINGIGYQEVASLPVKMESPFKDIANDHPHRNSIAIVAALGVFVGDKDGLFNPQQPVTWAELATVLTRIAPKINQRYY